MGYSYTAMVGSHAFDLARPPDTLASQVINAHGGLASWRPPQTPTHAYLAKWVARFPRSVQLKGVKPATPHALDVLLQGRPNGYQTSTKLWRTLFWHEAHYNNGYLRVERDPRTSRPVALHNLLPENVEPIRIDHSDGRGLQQYYQIFGGTPTRLNGDDVIHLAGMSYDGQAGLSPAMINGSTLQRASMLDRFQTRYLQHGTVIRGTLEFDKAVKPERISEIKQIIREQFHGTEFESDVLILTDGGKLNNSTITPQDGQLVQQQALSNKQIGQITDVPPPILFENSEGKYVNISEQVGRDVVTYTFGSLIDQAEDELTQKLLSPSDQAAGYAVFIDPSDLLRGDAKAQADIINSQVAAGVITRNEGRLKQGYPKSDDPTADKLIISGDTRKPATEPPAAGE